jgi:hypothetical protein
MSNKHKNSNNQTEAKNTTMPVNTPPTPSPDTNAAAEEVVHTGEVVNADTTLATAAPVEKKLARVEEVAPEDDGETMLHLVKHLPQSWKPILAATKQITDDELGDAADALPEGSRQNFRDMMARMNPVKPGVFTARRDFKVPEMKIFHGVGNDEARPKLLPRGGIYSDQGDMLCVPEDHAEMLKTPSKIIVAVLMLAETRHLWRPMDKKKVHLLPPGVDADGKGPICRSLDRVVGDKYGPTCDACPYSAWAQGEDKLTCGKDYSVYFAVMNPDMTFRGIFHMNIAKSSVKPGAGPIKKATDNWSVPYHAFFELTTKEETSKNPGESFSWFNLVSKPLSNTANPKGIVTTGADRALFEALNRKIATTAYLPALASVYARRAHAETSAPALPSASANLAALTASAAAPRDYSKSGGSL